MWQRTETSCQQPAQPAMWVNHLGSESSSPVKPSDETAAMANVWEVVTQSPSQTSNSRKLQNLTVNCCSEAQKFGVFCCSVIYNFYTGICKQYVAGRRNIKFKDTWHTQETASRSRHDKWRDQRWGLYGRGKNSGAPVAEMGDVQKGNSLSSGHSKEGREGQRQRGHCNRPGPEKGGSNGGDEMWLDSAIFWKQNWHPRLLVKCGINNQQYLFSE